MSTTDPPRPWRGLPDELKVKILEYALEIDKRTDLFEMSSLEPLLLTSKRMGDLALETWGKSKFEVWLPSSRMRMQYIDPEFGKHVRKLSLTIFLPDHLVWHDADLDTKCAPYMLVPYEIRGHRDTPWRVLLSCKSDGRLPLSEWQAALPNLKELYLHLRIQNRRPKHPATFALIASQSKSMMRVAELVAEIVASRPVRNALTDVPNASPWV
jgi:hypothetical protein